MTLLTLDRFAGVALNIKYELRITTKRTYIAISLVWAIGTILFLIMTFLQWQLNVDSMEVMHPSPLFEVSDSMV